MIGYLLKIRVTKEHMRILFFAMGVMMILADSVFSCELQRMEHIEIKSRKEYMSDIVGMLYTVTDHKCDDHHEVTISLGDCECLRITDIPSDAIPEVFEKLRRYLPHTHLCGKPYSKAKFVKLLQ
jgi:hypothetical protein